MVRFIDLIFKTNLLMIKDLSHVQLTYNLWTMCSLSSWIILNTFLQNTYPISNI